MEVQTEVNATDEAIELDEDKLNLRLLKNAFEKVSNIAKNVRKRLQKPFYFAIIQGIITSLIMYDWFAEQLSILLIIILLAFLPLFAVFFVRSRLHAVENIHEHIDTLENSGREIEEKLKQQGIAKDLKEFVSTSKDTTLRQRLKLLLSVAPTLYKTRESVKGLINPEIFLTVMSVSNPGFGLVTAISIFMVFAWCAGCVLLGITWLIL